MSKYEPLWDYLVNNKKENYKLTYEEIKKIQVRSDCPYRRT